MDASSRLKSHGILSPIVSDRFHSIFALAVFIVTFGEDFIKFGWLCADRGERRGALTASYITIFSVAGCMAAALEPIFGDLLLVQNPQW